MDKAISTWNHDLLERLAELEHEQWMAWAKTLMEAEQISEQRKKRWQRYMVPYAELPEDVKEHDRQWARKVLEMMCNARGTVYTRIDEDYDAWECSICGGAWSLTEGAPSENNMRYCPFCGARITAEHDPFAEEPEAEED